jgi:esterase/lipase
MIRSSTCLIAGLAAAFLSLACSGNSKLSLRHKESGLNTAFRYAGMAYPDYVAQMRRVILDTRQDLTPEQKDKILEWNSPFILEPDPASCPRPTAGRHRNGILLIHGLTDSPFHMRDLGEYFRRKCFLVYGLLLPGHGTVPGDLLEVTYEEWVKATAYGIEALKQRVERYFIGGFSTGGTLAVHAVVTGQRPAGLVLLAPALGLKDAGAFLAGAMDGIGRIDEGQRWLNIAADADPAKYESFPMNAGYQIWRLTKDLKETRGNRPLAVPVFAAFSADDMTVDSNVTLEVLRSAAPRNSRVLIYGQGGDNRGDERFVLLPAARPEEQILDFAHLSLTNSPANPHYGRNGDYRNCMHYLKKPESWERCKREPVPAGEITEENLGKGVLRRLTYNPDFPNLLANLDAFLAKLE